MKYPDRMHSACLAFLPVFLLLMGTAVGQVTTGVIFGTATDTSGAVIPGVTVTATNTETGLSRSTVTGSEGFFSLAALPPGGYRLTAEIAGFKKYEAGGITVTVGERVRVDPQLQVGEIADTVSVTASTVMMDTRSAEMSGLVDDKRITDLPLNGRNVIALASLIAGISTVSAPQVLSDSRSGPTMTVHGGRDNQNYLTLDGTYLNHPSRNTMMNPPPPDAVREFRITTQNFSAAEGRNSGANVSVVTRSGTNQLHFTAWEYHRNDNLNARSFFQVSKPNRIMNQYGIAGGGPIIKDKIHFFATYEGFRDRPQATTTGTYTPTAAERAGDFSHIKKQLVDPYTGAPYPGNQVPVSRMDSVAANILKLIPLPNQPDGRLVLSSASPNDNDLFMIRNDFQLNAKQSVFWHYYYNRNNRPPYRLGDIPDWNEQTDRVDFHNVALQHTYTVTPTLVSVFSTGVTTTDHGWMNTQYRSTESLGMSFPNYTDYGAPMFQVPGRFSLTSTSEWLNDSLVATAHESLSWVKAKHVFKFGAEFSYANLFQTWQNPPVFAFTGGRSGDVLLDFMTGAWQQLQISYDRNINDTVQPWYWSFYFQDEWRVKPRLTLTLGLRYELSSFWNDYRGIGTSSFVFPLDSTNRTKAPVNDAPDGYLFSKYDLPAGLAEGDHNNFAPRVGLAYDLSGDGRFVVRAGAGFFYDVPDGETMAQQNPPFSGTETYGSGGELEAPNVGLKVPLPPVHMDPKEGKFYLPMAARSVDQNLRTPYSIHWSLGLSRQMSRDIVISASYIGKTGKKWISSWHWNPGVYIPGTDSNGNPYSTAGNANSRVQYGKGVLSTTNLMLSSMFDNSYHGMELDFNKRFSSGLSLMTSYTLSKTITDKSSLYVDTSDAPNAFAVKASKRGLASFDRTHVINFSALWTPWSGAGRSDPLALIASDWTFSPMFRFANGSPLEILSNENRSLDGTPVGGKHPDLVGNPEMSHSDNQSKIQAWFNKSAFARPAIGTYGNAGVGLVRGPSTIMWNLGVLKDIPLGLEASRLQFRAEFFNMFNNTNFGNPDVRFTSSNFGKITSSGSGREIQLGIKFMW